MVGSIIQNALNLMSSILLQFQLEFMLYQIVYSTNF